MIKRSTPGEPESKSAVETGPGASTRRLSDEAVHEELTRVLSSRTFHAAEGQRKFLRYAVEQTLSGQSHVLKEYTIGVEAFGRGQSFDPRMDTIVRAEARKLRSRLAKYYESEGHHDPVRIEFPSRGYVPAFRGADTAGSLAPSPSVTMGSQPDSENGHGSRAGELEVLAVMANPKQSHVPDLEAQRVPVVSSAPAFRQWRKMALGAILLIAGGMVYTWRSGWFNPKSSAEIPSIAVLPFHNLGDVKDESFSDGLTEDLIASLGRVQGLHVVARTSAFQFRNTTLDIREIGQKLNVRTVLEGSVRIYGNRLRITAELDDSTNGYHLWADSYERDFQDALLLQRDISQAIVAALSAELAKSGNPSQLTFSPGRMVSVNAEAYQDYLKGVYFWNKQTAESINTAVEYFNRAIAKDPNYAPSYSGLARCYVNMPAFTMTRARDILPKIRDLAKKVLDLDSGLAEPHIDLAYADFLSYDWEGAEEEFKKGLALSPGDAVAHHLYAVYLTNAGHLKEALAESEIAQRLDPVSPYMLDGLARTLYMMRRYDEAIEQFKKTIALESRHGYAHLGLGMTYLQKRMYPEAIAELQIAGQQVQDSPSPPAGLAAAYAASGDLPKATKILEDFLGRAAQGPFPPKPIADVYLSLGDKDHAFEWLGKAIDGQDVNLYLKADAIYDPLRSDRRFAQLLQRANLSRF